MPNESGPVAWCGPQVSGHRAAVHQDDHRTPSPIVDLRRPIDVKTALTLAVNPGHVQDKRLQIRRSVRHRCSQARTTAPPIPDLASYPYSSALVHDITEGTTPQQSRGQPSQLDGDNSATSFV